MFNSSSPEHPASESGSESQPPRCERCRKKISDVVFRGGNGEPLCQKCVLPDSATGAACLPDTAAPYDAKPPRRFRKAKIAILCTLGAVIVMIGFAVTYTYMSPPVANAIIIGDLASAEQLLKSGADVNAATLNKSTPLHFASFKGDVRAVSLLLSYGAKLESRNKQGETPLMLAVSGRQPDTVDLLLANGASARVANPSGRSALAEAATFGQLRIVHSLIRSGADVNAPDLNGVRPLHGAALGGHTEVVDALLQAGAEINAKTSGGTTPLYVAAGAGRIECARMLLKRGSELEARDTRGRTPLMAASAAGRTDMLDFLISSGANAYVRDHQGNSVSDVKSFAAPGDAFVQMAQKSEWAVSLDRLSVFLCFAGFPWFANYLLRQHEARWQRTVWCYFRTVILCVIGSNAGGLLIAILFSLAGGTSSPDMTTVFGVAGVLGGGTISIWLAWRSREAPAPQLKARAAGSES
jgi:ankyrin repeat protein